MTTLLRPGDLDAATALLRGCGVFAGGETAQSAEPAGEGNMNVTLRVRSAVRSVIAKQSRPFVAKYPQIAAPPERVAAEARFYRLAVESPAAARWLPKLLAYDRAAELLVLEDLGESADFLGSYRGGRAAEFRDVAESAAAIHAVPLGHAADVECRPLRELNADHMFGLPFGEEPPVDLDAIVPGLAARTQSVRHSTLVRDAAARLRCVYFTPVGGGVLLHGDFYPGSWLRTAGGLRVIDPEFAFAGPAEFDLGVAAGHAALATGRFSTGELFDAYGRASGREPDRELASRFAATEVLRRLLGVAQLPLRSGLEWRVGLASEAADVLTG